MEEKYENDFKRWCEKHNEDYYCDNDYSKIKNEIDKLVEEKKKSFK